MKKIGLITMIAAAAISFAACNSEPKDSKETADSLNEVKDSTNTADSTSTMASSEHDAEFATEAAAGGMSEVEFGKAALTKSTNAKVKEFANMMVNDHGKANQELMLIAKSKNINLPLSDAVTSILRRYQATPCTGSLPIPPPIMAPSPL